MIAELLFGFRYGSQFERNRAVLGGFLADERVKILPVTWATAERYGTIAAALRTAGTPIPSNDIWIAAHAFESGAELLRFDAHFAAVPGLVWTQLR